MIYYDPENFSASTWFGTIGNAMYNEYLNYWEQQNIRPDSDLTEDDRERVARLMRVSSSVRSCIHSLSVTGKAVDAVREFLGHLGYSGEVNNDFAARIVRGLEANPVVRHGVEIDLALESADNLLAGAETRFTDLIALISARTLSQRASAYLDRATRLYLWGFEPEAVVMCAAVIEAAYPERFSDQEMVRLQIKKVGREFRPSDYELAAVAAGVFSEPQGALAKRIRQSRNDIVHNVPSVDLTAKQALTGTAELLDSLFPG